VSPQGPSPTDEAGAVPAAESAPAGEPKEASRSFLQSSRRALSEEELSVPAVRRFLIYEVERLEAQCKDQLEVVVKYHDLRVEMASVKALDRANRWLEILSSVCLAIGSAGLGAAASYMSLPGTPYYIGWILLVLASLLVVVGVASRIRK
jgi:hypothetical protein